MEQCAASLKPVGVGPSLHHVDHPTVAQHAAERFDRHGARHRDRLILQSQHTVLEAKKGLFRAALPQLAALDVVWNEAEYHPLWVHPRQELTGAQHHLVDAVGEYTPVQDALLQ